MRRTLDRSTIRAIAEEVVKVIGENRQPEFVTTEEASKILGITTSWLRHTKYRYPHIKKGDGPKGRLLFSKDELVKNWQKP